MLADGNGDFAEAVGLAMDGSKFGMGKRSQRYSMIVNDGVVEQLNVEAPGEYRASSAETYARPAGDRLTALAAAPTLLAAGVASGETAQRFQSFNRIRERNIIQEEEIMARKQQSRRPEQQPGRPQPVQRLERHGGTDRPLPPPRQRRRGRRRACSCGRAATRSAISWATSAIRSANGARAQLGRRFGERDTATAARASWPTPAHRAAAAAGPRRKSPRKRSTLKETGKRPR